MTPKKSQHADSKRPQPISCTHKDPGAEDRDTLKKTGTHTASHFRGTEVPTTPRRTPEKETPDPLPSRGLDSPRGMDTHSPPPRPWGGRAEGGLQAPAAPAESACLRSAGGCWVEAAERKRLGRAPAPGVGRESVVKLPAGATLGPTAAVGARGPSQSAAATRPSALAPPLQRAAGLSVPRAPSRAA